VDAVQQFHPGRSKLFRPQRPALAAKRIASREPKDARPGLLVHACDAEDFAPRLRRSMTAQITEDDSLMASFTIRIGASAHTIRPERSKASP
jgi:hypothetical protein